MEKIDELKFPIGDFNRDQEQSEVNRIKWRTTIAELPTNLRRSVTEMTDDQLDTPYRPGGWTVRQLVHHIADSHMNAYIRFHWGLSEDEPTIKAYDQDAWAKLPDYNGPIDVSLTIIDGIHRRLTHLLQHMSQEDYNRVINHPDWDTPLSLGMLLSLYAWHSEHHLAHINNLSKRKGWKKI